MKRLYIVILGCILVIPIILYKTGFFVVDKPVKSNYLVIEGWLNSDDIDHTPFDYNDFDTIFVVGVKKSDRWNIVEQTRQKETKNLHDHARLITNGYLFLKDYEKKNIPDSISTVSIVAKGSAVEGEFAHFFVSVKDSVFGHTFVHEQIDTFTFNVKMARNKIALFNLYFNNDRLTKNEDINLQVYNILLDTFSFLPAKNECFYLKRDLSSSAKMNANYLSSKPGIKAKIIVVDTLFRSWNNTSASARALNKYLNKNQVNLTSVNIYTYPTHSRRTKLAYEKALPVNIAVGTYITNHGQVGKFKRSGHLNWYLAVWDELISWIGTVFLPRSSG